MMQQFLSLISSDPEARAMVRSMPVPKNDREAAEGYVLIARELGFDFTVEEIAEGLKTLAASRKLASDKVSLGEDALDNVAGGADHPELCKDTFNDGEWCWFTDSCDSLISDYSDGLETERLYKNGIQTCVFSENGFGDYNNDDEITLGHF